MDDVASCLCDDAKAVVGSPDHLCGVERQGWCGYVTTHDDVTSLYGGLQGDETTQPLTLVDDVQDGAGCQHADVLLSGGIDVDALSDAVVGVGGTAGPEALVVAQQVYEGLRNRCLKAWVAVGLKAFGTCEGVWLVADKAYRVLLSRQAEDAAGGAVC